MFLTSGAGGGAGPLCAASRGGGGWRWRLEPGRGARVDQRLLLRRSSGCSAAGDGVFLVVRGRAPGMLLAVVEALRGAGLERAASETTDISLSYMLFPYVILQNNARVTWRELVK